MNIRIKIAGHIFDVRYLCRETAAFLEKYCTGEPAESVIVIQPEELVLPQLADERRGVFHEPDWYEPGVLLRKCASLLFPHGCFFLHSAAVAADGDAYLFVAPARTGKSTHIRHWKDILGSRIRIINSDLPVISGEKDIILVSGSPWEGKEQNGCNLAFPLRAVCLLSRAEENIILPCRPQDAAEALSREVLPEPRSRSELASVECVIQRAVSSAGLYSLACTDSPEAARLAWEAMKPS